MATTRRDALKKHAITLLDQLHQETDIPAIMGLIGLTADQRHFVMAESGINRKWRFLDLLSQSVSDVGNWNDLVGYLESSSRSELAELLTSSAKSTEWDRSNDSIQHRLAVTQHIVGRGTYVLKRSQKPSLEEFSIRLSKYYQTNYAHLPTMGESPKHIGEVWVPLQIDGRSEDHLATDRIDHTELLNRLKSTKGRNVAIVKGDPGMGKTTLAKKIAYDWAINYGTSKTQQFSLVLSVPLRAVGKSNRFDQLAIKYFLSIMGIKEIDNAELITGIQQLDDKLLIILDGLDEYTSYGKSPFKVMFAPPFTYTAANSLTLPPIINFKLIITSRPYACERVNEEFWPLRFVIMPLDIVHVSEFVQLYCQTPHGVEKVNEYLKTKVKLVIQVPLILMFVCYLADSVQEIPANMTSLYDRFIRQMLRREHRHAKLSESLDIRKWSHSSVVKATSELAYRGSIDGIVAFSSVQLETSKVTKDSFICGFLLHKFDFANDILSAEFPHRSIQEFFAALHCYQMMLSGRKDVLREVNKLIAMVDSLVGRFFLGICSKEGRFGQLTNWLSPSLLVSEDYTFSPAELINGFGAALEDCSARNNEQISTTLLESVCDVGRFVSSCRIPHLPADTVLQIDPLADGFKEAIHLGSLTVDAGGLTSDWYLGYHTKSPRLVCVRNNKLATLLQKEFEQIDVLVMGYTTNRLLQMNTKILFAQLQSLPPVATLLVTTGGYSSSPTICIIVCIRYRRKLGLKLRNLRFEYSSGDRDELLDNLTGEELVDMTVDKRGEFEKSDRMTSRLIKVTLNDNCSQSALILALVRTSLLEENGHSIGGSKCSCCRLS